MVLYLLISNEDEKEEKELFFKGQQWIHRQEGAEGYDEVHG